MKRKLISVSLALALGLSLAACGSKPAPSGAETPAGELGTLSGPVELQFWHSISNQNHLKVLEGLVEEFNETIGAEKGITVVPTFNGSSSELYSSVVGAIKAGSAPDVTLALRPYVADYLQTDYVVNLEPYITDPNVGMTDYEDIFEGLREANSSYAKEGIYSLPIHSYSEVLYYNKTFFAEHGLSVPTTWDELVETCRAIRDITGAPAFGWDNLAGSFMTLLLQNGGRYTDQNGNLYFATEDSDITLKVLQMWQDNVNEGIWRTAGEDQFFSGPFANEMIPMYIGDSVEASYIPDKNPELDWGTAPVPQVSEDTAANLSAGQRQLLTIARVFLCDPPILILDEATSASDPENQMEIDKAIQNLCKGKTVIVVAHRLSALKMCERVAVVENHTITCVGTHEEVRKNNAYYRKAWEDYETARNITYQLEGGEQHE